jgi:TetR/AcrR family transcriptional regulator, transcriptional repressor for nem operon
MTRRPNNEARECILKTAFKLFYRKGFKGVSMDEVATAAGMKKANVFHYYPTKDTLGLAVFDSASQMWREKFSAFLAEGKGDPIRSVESLFDQTSAAMKENCCEGGCFIGNAAQEMSDENETLRQKIAQHLREWTKELTELLSRSRASGYFRPTLDPESAAQAILSLFEGSILLCKATRDTHPMENARRMAAEYLQVHRA